jgi:ribosomal protein S18 acetylase RimI-like enzyme
VTAAAVAADVKAGRVRRWLCENDATVAGFCRGEATGEGLVLAVLPEYQGQGIGKRLLAEAESVGWLRA